MDDIHGELIKYIASTTSSARHLEHPECRTSEESARAREAAGAGWVTGAKAILMKLDTKSDGSIFALFVLPGFSKIDSKALKAELKRVMPEVRRFRFATSDEMSVQARGMQPGCMPPYGRPIFPDIAKVFVDASLQDGEKVGFNAARFDRSIVIPTGEYLKSVEHDDILRFAE